MSLKDVHCGYGEREILSGITFELDEPGFVCIIGPNGVGKSTLVKLIDGIIKPTSGTVEIMGRNLEEYSLRELSKVVGYVPVMTSDFNVMSVLDTVLIGRFSHQKWRTTSRDIQVAVKALKAMEIDDLINRNFNELSAGQRQKVSISRGLVQEPEILILDEPTANLDIRHQLYVSAFLRRLSEKAGMTAFTVSHDLNLAAKYATKIIVLEKPGKIYSIGKPEDVITKQMIKDVYNVDCDIVDDNGTPHVILQGVLGGRGPVAGPHVLMREPQSRCMPDEITVALIDGYIDDPAALGVPPYISPMIRAIAGAAIDAGADRVEYVTIDMIRDGAEIPDAAVTVVLSGNTVPGKYLRSMPMSMKELDALFPKLRGWRMIGGSAADSDVAQKFDFIIKRDMAASLYDGMIGKEVGERLRTLDEWNRWMLLGADIVTKHQDFPQPLVAEIESYRGCHRYASGGCSYCIEPMKGRPLMRSPQDILAEARKLRDLGVRNIRIGGQTCIVSYGSDPDSAVPRPNPAAVRELFEGLRDMGFDTIHTDNANAAVIATYPEESREVLQIIADCCTDGNIVALGMESADPIVVRENNLNSTSEQVMAAVRMINEIGAERGPRGMPKLLPGINIIAGLDGETSLTYKLDMELLEQMCDEGLMIRRINIRQVLPVRREFRVRVDQRGFKKFKEDVRETVDRTMLERVVPFGTILKDVYMELNDGNVTFGRQIGSYPLLVGVPYRLEVGTAHDVMVMDWGYRSITGITYPFRINEMPMSALEALPGVGKKRATKLVLERPFSGPDDLSRAIDDPKVIEGLLRFVSFDRPSSAEATKA